MDVDANDELFNKKTTRGKTSNEKAIQK